MPTMKILKLFDYSGILIDRVQKHGKTQFGYSIPVSDYRCKQFNIEGRVLFAGYPNRFTLYNFS